MKRLLLAATLACLGLAWVPVQAAVGADVSVTASSAASLAPGDLLSYVITVTAGGTGDSTDVKVLAPLPDTIPAWTVTGDTAGCTPAPDGGVVNIGGGSVLVCEYASIAEGSSKVLTLESTPDGGACPGIELSAIVASGSDTDPSNNKADNAVAVVCPTDVGVSVSGANVAAGRNAEFVIVVTPGGDPSTPDPADVVLSTTVPTGTTWTVTGNTAGCTPAPAANGSITAPGGTSISCNYGTLTRPDKAEDVRREVGDPIPPAIRSLTLTGSTTFANCDGFSGSASVASSNDGDSSNDAAVHDIAVNCGIAMEQADSINHVTDLEYAFVTCPTASLPRGSHVPKSQGVNGIIALVGPAAGGTLTLTPTGPHADEELFAVVFYDATCARIPGAGLVEGAGDVVSGPIPANAKAASILYVEGPSQGVDTHGELHGVGSAVLEFELP